MLPFKLIKKGFADNKGNIINAILYFSPSIVQLGISVFTSPVFARNLEPEDYAIIGYYASLSSFINPVLLLSFPRYFIIKYFRQSEEESRQLLFNLLFFMAVFNIVFIFFLYVLLKQYFDFFNVTIAFYPFAIMSLATIFFTNFRSVTLTNVKIRKLGFVYFLLGISWSIVSVSLRLYFVVHMKMGAEGSMLGSLIASGILAAACLIYIRKWMVPKVSIKTIKESLYYSFPLIIATYAYVPILNIDRIYLERVGNTYEFGYYNIGFTLANYFRLAAKALFKAIEPDLYRFVSKNDRKKLITSIFFFLGLLFVGTLVFVIISPAITDYLTSGRYTRACKYANVLVISVFIMNIYTIFEALIYANQKTRVFIYINGIGGISAIIIYWLMIEQYTFYGAAYGRIIVALILSLVSSLFYLRIKILNKKQLN